MTSPAGPGQVLRFADADLAAIVAHNGAGAVLTSRVLDREPGDLVTFIDLTVVPPGVSIGVHTHGPDDEELYVVIDGTGMVELDGRTYEVGSGDVVVNAPGGTHALHCDGPDPLRLVVVAVARVGQRPAR